MDIPFYIAILHKKSRLCFIDGFQFNIIYGYLISQPKALAPKMAASLSFSSEKRSFTLFL